MVIVNILAEVLPINGQTTADISNKENVLFTPAGYVFSIWGLIYFLLFVWVVIQCINKKNSTRQTTLFIISCGLNIAWLLTWHYELFMLSTGCMIALLIILILLYRTYAVTDFEFGGRFPFSFYLGWISVATIANISYTLQHYNISLGISEVSGTIALIIIAGTLALIGRVKSNDAYFAIVFVWAIIGIAEKNTNTAIVTTAYTVAIVLFIAIIAMTFLQKNKRG